jgi:hypothetical protein
LMICIEPTSSRIVEAPIRSRCEETRRGA